MPTKDDFGPVAASLRKLAGELAEVALPLERMMGPEVLQGGELTDSVYESMKVARVTGLSLSAIVDEYAAEAQRRYEEAIEAEKVREAYEKEMRHFRNMTNHWEQYQDGDWPRDRRPPDRPPSEPPTRPPDPPGYIEL